MTATDRRSSSAPTAVGVNNHLSAKLNGPAGVVVGKKLTFTTASTGGTPALPGSSLSS